MNIEKFSSFFQGEALRFLEEAIDLALREDGRDLTSEGVFPPDHRLGAKIIAKEDTLVAGLPIIPLVMERCGHGEWSWKAFAHDGDLVADRTVVATIEAGAARLLKAERIILNFITHMSGIANLTRRYVQALNGTGTRLLDTRKTLPGLRYPEKYAVLVGGGLNHRKNLEEMLMLKDNHVDLAGGITPAVSKLRATYSPCPPIEVECRTLAEVQEAVLCKVERIMLDNMNTAQMCEALELIPDFIETEVSGGVTLETIHALASASAKGPDFISVGRLTHSAPIADFSMLVQ
jgi:nicotinate-nucleotide pyrophosphorylase (carboxylating)